MRVPSNVGQLREANNPTPNNDLKTHRLKDDLSPACGDQVRPFNGMPNIVVELPVGTPVTCQRNGCRE
jgi:hypothetical protein